jgi:hypothetical protein
MAHRVSVHEGDGSFNAFFAAQPFTDYYCPIVTVNASASVADTCRVLSENKMYEL